MSWFISHGKWNCKVPDGTGNRKSFSSGVESSRPNIKWKDEIMSIKKKAEKVIMQRVGDEGIQMIRRSDNVLFGEVSKMYKENFNTDKYRMNLIENEFADRQIRSITPLDIQRFKKKLLETRLPTTWNRYRNDLCAIFNRGKDWKMCKDNPVKDVKKSPDVRVIDFISGEHADRLLTAAKKKSFYLYSWVFFALMTGRRVGEILKVEWSDVNFMDGVIRFHISKKSGGWEIKFRMPPKEVFEMLRFMKKVNAERPFPYFPKKQWEEIRDKVHAEVNLPDKRFHALRHRCATSMIERGATLYDVQHYLCHSDPRTTMIYAHVSKERDEAIRQILER